MNRYERTQPVSAYPINKTHFNMHVSIYLYSDRFGLGCQKLQIEWSPRLMVYKQQDRACIELTLTLLPVPVALACEEMLKEEFSKPLQPNRLTISNQIAKACCLGPETP